jgi:hypothetical protein
MKALAALALLSLLGCADSVSSTGDAAPVTCPSPAGVVAGAACSPPSSLMCTGAVACAPCGAFGDARYAPPCSCQSGRWACGRVDCGPMPGCGFFSDGMCAIPAPCDAGADVPDASADAATDGGVCPPGTCRFPLSPRCEAPTGVLGNGCCMCGADGFCAAPCQCAAPDTPIATPAGDRPIATLRPGDLVYSAHHGALRVVPLLAVQRVPVRGHHVVRVETDDGVSILMSEGHPTADGRVFGTLRAGDRLDGRRLRVVERVAYPHDATWDILPDSDTGTYVAAGTLLGSTLRLPHEAPLDP